VAYSVHYERSRPIRHVHYHRETVLFCTDVGARAVARITVEEIRQKDGQESEPTETTLSKDCFHKVSTFRTILFWFLRIAKDSLLSSKIKKMEVSGLSNAINSTYITFKTSQRNKPQCISVCYKTLFATLRKSGLLLCVGVNPVLSH
jgi:hypothetical protein